MSNNEEKWIKYGKLLSGLIHNLNTPLMGLSGRVELLQMKFDDEKSFKQINTQLDKINNMLMGIAYLLDKEQTSNVSNFMLDKFFENFNAFMATDMRYKHQVEKEITIEPCNVSVIPQQLIFIVYTVVDYLLDYVNEESTLKISNDLLDTTTIIEISLESEEPFTSKPDLSQVTQDKFNELKDAFSISFSDFSFKFSLNISDTK